MATFDELIATYARSVQPLVFETGVGEFPYGTQGTVFLAGYAGHSFVITTRHGLSPATTPPICVFPSDTSHRLLPLGDVFFVPEDAEPEDYVDLALISIDTARVVDAEVAAAPLIVLSPTLHGWPEHAAELVLMGFPEDLSFVDPENQELHTERFILKAHYEGPSALPYLQQAVITDPHSLSTFSGFSGGPVFAVLRPPDQPASIGLCGMALRGSSSSNIIHFLDRSVLIQALKVRTGRGAAG